METITRLIESILKENPCDLEVFYNEPMAEHSTFKVGGPADCWLKPSGDGFPMFTVALLQAARVENVPVFILGGGANILVADAGIRGIVLDTGGWAGLAGQGDGTLEFRSGTSLDTAADIAAGLGLSGLEFLAGMPGSIGGAVWMNARCYGVEIADVLKETEVVDFSGSEPQHRRIMAKKEEFAYKHSPFQNQRSLILSAAFFVKQAEAHEIRVEMNAHRKDREDKGHYRYPSAGSIFKNNPGFGKPAGKIIDELGLRGLQKGGAQVAPWHGNIIVNLGSATAQDIRDLVDEVSVKVTAATGFVFEPEVLFAGEWLY